MKTIIKCDPGWFLVAEYFVPEGATEHPGFYQEPIIAWQIESEVSMIGRPGPMVAVVTPITFSGPPPDTAQWAVLRPDGIVQEEGGEATFPSLSAFEADALLSFDIKAGR